MNQPAPRPPQGPAIPMIRRHTKGANEELHFEPALRVVSGNYVAAKRRGIVDGVDFGFTGEVRGLGYVCMYTCGM